MGKKKKRCVYKAGSRPYVVSVFERTRDGPLYLRHYDPRMNDGQGGYRRRSLKHSDKERAKALADETAAKLRRSDARENVSVEDVTLSRVFSEYRKHHTPEKVESEQKADGRRIEMWQRVIGAHTDPHKVSLREWNTFKKERRSGEIDARGKRVEKTKDRRPVGARTVEADLDWLSQVFRWATLWRLSDGAYLMESNPVRGFETPTEKNPKRPVATWERYEKIRKKTDDVAMEVRWTKKIREQRSYLSEILDIVVGTGRRISAVCGLRYSDLRLEKNESRPFGAIVWPADTDKEGKEWAAPVNRLTRRAIDRVLEERPGVGDKPLFPSPEDSSQPIRYELASKWLRKAEELAKVEPHDGSLWHAYRRMWATARKELPSQDVAKAGGWASVRMVEDIYTQADEETTLNVVLHDAKVREARDS